jgi:hypothetical protein
MLGIDRVGKRRSQAILTRNFPDKTGTGTKKKKNGPKRNNWFHVTGTRDETMTKTETK